MGEVVIRSESLGKRYQLGLIHHDRLADALAHQARKVARGFGKRSGKETERDPASIPAAELAGHGIHPGGTDHIWALRNASFEIEKGEAVGIIGHNGAGKSTLLKILTGITEPSEGRVTLQGRIASLLEVGTGFHPELTGRENIYMNGAMLGMSRAHINRHFEQIVAFAEVATFIDTPVKRYSSGMYVRLAFAVAAHLEPEILLVDEVLAVGDLAFQKKCLGQMNDAAQLGRTILFVSHNMAAIRQLTQRCIYLHGGEVKRIGPTGEIVQQYYRDAQAPREGDAEDLATAAFRRGEPGDELHIAAVEVQGTRGRMPVLPMFEALQVTLVVQVDQAVRDASAAIRLKNDQGVHVATLFSRDQGCRIDMDPGKNRLVLHMANPLTPGKYFADLGINPSTGTRAYDALMDFPLFEVANEGQVQHWTDRGFGAMHQQDARWTVEPPPATDTAGP